MPILKIIASGSRPSVSGAPAPASPRVPPDGTMVLHGRSGEALAPGVDAWTGRFLGARARPRAGVRVAARRVSVRPHGGADRGDGAAVVQRAGGRRLSVARTLSRAAGLGRLSPGAPEHRRRRPLLARAGDRTGPRPGADPSPALRAPRARPDADSHAPRCADGRIGGGDASHLRARRLHKF